MLNISPVPFSAAALNVGAITFVQSKTATTGAVAAATLDLVFDSTPTPGNIIAVAVCSQVIASCSATGIDFYQVSRSAINSTGVTLAIGWVQASPSATITAAFAGAAINSCIVGAEYSSISNSLDQSVAAIGSSTSPSSGATDTTTAANELWLGAMGQRNTNAGAVFSLPLNSFAIVDQTNTSTAVANADRAVVLLSRIVSSTGTVTAACTSSVNNNWAAVALSLK